MTSSSATARKIVSIPYDNDSVTLTTTDNCQPQKADTMEELNKLSIRNHAYKFIDFQAIR